MKITADFVTSAATADGLPADGLREIVLVGRSNVGKSSLINALVRQRVARTSAAPGKTRLANVYRVARGSADPLYLVDLPGYGYARGGPDTARAFDELARAYFERGAIAALLLVDARHPGLPGDVEAWRWLRTQTTAAAVVATKIDKLARGARTRALRTFESVLDAPVLPVSAVTGEGLEDLWTLIDRLARSSPSRPSSRRSPPPNPPPSRPGPPAATATAPAPRRHPKSSSGSTSRRSRT